jgi:penicillin-binding protein 2
MFAVLFFRLWSLQVLSGDRYLSAAQGNQLRVIRVEAPRGTIVDRTGRTIVENVPGTAVKLWVNDLPKRGRYEVVRRLATLLNLDPARLAKEVDERRGDPLTPITVKTAVDERKIAYLYEHQADFPGVRIQQTYLRDYRNRTLAAQLLGYLGEISPEELKRRAKEDYRGGDTVGKTGVEAAFDEYLRGKPGQAQILVDSLGRQTRGIELHRAAIPGSSVRLTIDLGLQRAAERALRHGIALAIENESYHANAGAIVALDPRNGAVLAMASYPTYDPSVYVGRLNPKKVAPLLDDKAAAKANYPALNRATQVAYPPGSTWKPVVALAAMQEHLLTPNELIQCQPVVTYGRDEQKFRNWNPYVNEPMRLIDAIAESCDTYFYDVGNRFYETNRTRMQEWAEKFGFGAPTGIDVGWEQETLVPTPEWRKRTFEGDWDRAWNPGDSIQLAIGQKDVTVTPLQMARFYAMIANGGKLVTPHVVSAIEERGAEGEDSVIKVAFPPDPPQSSIVDPYALRVVQDGLFAATHGRDGTSSGTFGTYPIPIAGKTGTAEKVVPIPGYPADHLEDQAWWCGYGPAEDARIVVCAVIENGGHGGTSAAPAALQVFEKFFGVKGNPVVSEITD